MSPARVTPVESPLRRSVYLPVILFIFKGSKVKRIQRMAYRKFKADQLFDGYHLHGNDKVLITDDSGKVQSLAPASEAGDDVQNFSGILSPG